MYLSEKEKRWVNWLNEGKIKTYMDFLPIEFSLIPTSIKITNPMIPNGNASREEIGIYIENDDKLVDALSDFDFFIQKLATYHLVGKVNIGIHQDKILYYITDNICTHRPSRVNNTIALLYGVIQLSVASELEVFIRNDYKTGEEIEKQKDEAYKNESLKVTRRIAYISICASVIISLLTTILNIITYNNNRNVTIKSIETPITLSLPTNITTTPQLVNKNLQK